jgi:hypothetical protein
VSLTDKDANVNLLLVMVMTLFLLTVTVKAMETVLASVLLEINGDVSRTALWANVYAIYHLIFPKYLVWDATLRNTVLVPVIYKNI